MEREQVSTLKHEHTDRYYLFRQPLLSPDLERTIDGRCSAFVIFVVFRVALAGGATVLRQWVGTEDWRLLHKFRRTVEGLEVTGLVTLIYNKL